MLFPYEQLALFFEPSRIVVSENASEKVKYEQLSMELRRPYSADVINAIDIIRLCERTLPLLFHSETSVREKESLYAALEKLYFTLEILLKGSEKLQCLKAVEE